MTRRRQHRMRATLTLISVVLLGALLTGCMGVPSAGPVVPVGPGAQSETKAGIAIDPRPPREGMGPSQIVDGFLEAMLAAPSQTATAQKFLTKDARANWKPAHQILVYAGREQAQVKGDQVTVDLGPTWRVDDRGVWRGAVNTADRSIDFSMVRDGDEWRIADVPDALLVPDWWFEGRYSQMALYYFNASETMLVPEPIFVPRGNELATVLVRNLVLGPSSELTAISHSVIPADVGDGLSVPIDENGLADIELTADPGQAPLTSDEINLITAQFAWTLRQDPDITTVRLSIGGTPVIQPNGRSEFSVADAGPQFDPAGYQSTPLVFGVLSGKVVAGTLPNFNSTPGGLGRIAHDIRSIGVDLRGQQVAAVSSSGRSVLLSSMSDREETARPVLQGAVDLLAPSWDGGGRLWLLDRRRRGAAITVIQSGDSTPVAIPGITGENVREFLVSRDGTRVLAVVRTDGTDRIVVARIASPSAGPPIAVAAAQVINPDLGQIDDIGWASPTSVTVLHGLDNAARVTTLPVDGAGEALQPGGTLVGEPLSELVSSPAAGQPAYGVEGTTLVSLSAVGRDQPLAATITSLTYAG
jgi:hypothetical protein